SYPRRADRPFGAGEPRPHSLGAYREGRHLCDRSRATSVRLGRAVRYSDNPKILMFPPGCWPIQGDPRSSGMSIEVANHKLCERNRRPVVGQIKVVLLAARPEPEPIG